MKDPAHKTCFRLPKSRRYFTSKQLSDSDSFFSLVQTMSEIDDPQP
jgi:hypothetical protein